MADELSELLMAWKNGDAAALVQEAYLLMANQVKVEVEHGAQFFGLAAKIMRNILVAAARRRKIAKRAHPLILILLSAAERFVRPAAINLADARRRLV